ncbi:hypothetical protein C8A03DRAFT_15806 [Achaetomium macrosporum]|uniref:Uncharacterized protein n=1 Tax=Achaetomium macrosporum TaxID=79813 RepID=A0AAN7HBR8_9PEZI|nr:hypothetical protein C8A03DRAFT_15806 [Achaetomium macrosporum]
MAVSSFSIFSSLRLPLQRPVTASRTLSPYPRPNQTSYFSTTRAALSGTTSPNPNPSYPAFSLKRISPNPRVRMALGAGLALLTVAEGYAIMKFWPNITGQNKGQGSSD